MKKLLIHLVMLLFMGTFAFSSMAIAQGSASTSGSDNSGHAELNTAIKKAHVRHRDMRRIRRSHEDTKDRLNIDWIRIRHRLNVD